MALKSLKSGRPLVELQPQVLELVMPIIQDRLKYAPADLIYSFFDIVKRQGTMIAAQDIETCYKFYSPNYTGHTNINPYLTPEIRMEEIEAANSVIRDAGSELTTFDKNKAEESIQIIISNLASIYGNDIDLLDREPVDQSELSLTCFLYNDYYNEIYKLPKDQVVNLFLYSMSL